MALRMKSKGNMNSGRDPAAWYTMASNNGLRLAIRKRGPRRNGNREHPKSTGTKGIVIVLKLLTGVSRDAESRRRLSDLAVLMLSSSPGLNHALLTPRPLSLHCVPKELRHVPVPVILPVEHLTGGVLVVQCSDNERQVFVGNLSSYYRFLHFHKTFHATTNSRTADARGNRSPSIRLSSCALR
jgi:hypothetical protein